MSVLKKVDDAIIAAMRDCLSPQKHQFIIVLSTEARNELWSDISILGQLSRFEGDRKKERYRGIALAVCHDDDAPPVAVFSRRNP